MNTYYAFLALFLLNLIAFSAAYGIHKLIGKSKSEITGEKAGIKGKIVGPLAGFLVVLAVEAILLLKFRDVIFPPPKPHPAETVVREFYKNVNEKAYHEAFAKITRDYQVRHRGWKGMESNFTQGYADTVSLNKIAVIPASIPEDAVAQLFVTYIDTTKSPVISALDNIGKKSLRALPDIVKSIDELKGMVQAAGIPTSPIDDFMLWQLTHPANSNILDYNLSHQEGRVYINELERLWGSSKITKEIPRAIMVTAIKDRDSGSWLINDFKPVN